MPRPQPSVPQQPPPYAEHGTRCYQVLVWVVDEHGEDWWALNHPDLDRWAQEIAMAEREDKLGYDKQDTGAASSGLTCSGPAATVANLLGALKRAWQRYQEQKRLSEQARWTGGAD